MSEKDGNSNKDGNLGGSFEKRLISARGRQRLDPPSPASGRKSDRSDASAMGIGLRVGVEMVSALVLGLAIGWGLDRWFGTKPIMLAVFVVLGGAAGVLNVWRVFAPRD